MIKINGPREAAAGERVCLSVSGVGTGFSVVVADGDKKLRFDLVTDPHTGTAEVCFTIPPGSPGVSIWASNSGDRNTTQFDILAL